MDDELIYPSLATCEVKLIGSAESSRPPVELPKVIREDFMATIPYINKDNNSDDKFNNFSLERAVLKRKEERDHDKHSILGTTLSREELEKATISKMKDVTGESDDIVCVALLQDHGYNLEESIEAYLESN
mmetsp:Transcript_14855/g.16655  ORF Transcript_14855/g.16655 Transcript_14855/m.16655 type:complete len:131 (+) Transcript_14855:200-592(+)